MLNYYPLNDKVRNMNSDFPIDISEKTKNCAEHVVRLARQLADGNRPGVLATVDREGAPHLRWMATLSLQDFPHLYALTSPTSRKVEHIHHNPRVSWMFTTDTSSMVINLSGTATLITDKSEVNRIWRLIENKSKCYFLSLDTVSEGVAVIDTVIEDVDCIVPKYNLHYPARDEDYPLLGINPNETQK